jgi:nicotinate-nucleotide--dimethylbenzimidazole phosphoribosyltransferase
MTTSTNGATWLRDALGHLPTADTDARDSAAARAAQVIRPPGALQVLDDVAAWVAGWHGTALPRIERPALVIFAADHGVAAHGVSAFPTSVTGAMVAAFDAGKATCNAFARSAGATSTVIDVGVGRPTGDIRTEAAMDQARFDMAIDAGRAAVEALDTDLLIVGEMGIGNTTVAAALAAALHGGSGVRWCGRGTGVDDDGLTRKRDAVDAAVARIGAPSASLDPIEIMREVGGAELTAMAAAVVAARLRRIPVLLDGFIVTAAMAPLAAAAPDALAHCWAGHRSAEPGHGRLLELLGLDPLLTLDLRLGEASGALAALPLVRMACAGVSEVPTFGEWFG